MAYSSQKMRIVAKTEHNLRLSGVTDYQSIEREFSTGDRVQFTAPDKQLGVANRELGTVEKIDAHGNMSLRLEDARRIQLNATPSICISITGTLSPATAPKD